MKSAVVPAEALRSNGSSLRVAGIALLLGLATLGEGGGSVFGLLGWHVWLVLLLVAVLLLERNGGANSQGAGFSVGLGAFGLLVGIGAIRAPYAYGAWLLLIELAACCSVVALAAGVGPALLRPLLWPLRVVAVLQGLLVLSQRFVLGELRPAGTFLNANHASAWLVATSLLGLAALPTLGGPRRRGLAAVFVLPPLAAVLVLGSRGAFIGLALGGLALLALNWRRLAVRGRTVAIGALALLMLLLAGALMWRWRQADPFRWHRAPIWRASIGAIVGDPLWGTGPGQFSVAAANLRFPDHDGPLRYDRQFGATHSDLLRLPAEFGIPAAAILLLTLGLGALTVARRLRGERTRTEEGAVAAICAIGMQALVDNPSDWPSVYLLVSVLAGTLLSRRRSAHEGRPRIVRGVLAVLLLIVFTVGDLGPTLAFLEASRLPRGRLDASQRAILDRAVLRNRIHPDLWLRRAEDLAGRGDDWDAGTYAAAREAAETAVRLQPADASVLRGLARIEALACRTLFRDEASRDRVARAYERAERRSRFDPLLPTELAALLLDTGDAGAARRAAERALRLEPGSVTPRLLLADALLNAGAEGGERLAGELLVEARELRRASARQHGRDGYARALLAPDPAHFERLERRLAESRQAP